MFAIKNWSILLVAGAHMYGQGTAADRTVTICTEPGVVTLGEVQVGEMLASKIFAGIGVNVDWRYKVRDCPETGVRLSFGRNTPSFVRSGALAYAAPYQRTKIHIFYDRVPQHGEPGTSSIVLAYVLAHEIAHVIEGIERHSDRGLMKAHWNAHDLFEMKCMRLKFAPEDIGFIYRGLNTEPPRTILAQNEKQTAPARAH